jgi:hypothetical protein
LRAGADLRRQPFRYRDDQAHPLLTVTRMGRRADPFALPGAEITPRAKHRPPSLVSHANHRATDDSQGRQHRYSPQGVYRLTSVSAAPNMRCARR